ncbi:hypothetical protein ACI2LC_24855 [Nonomuraea wenchangensis]|uniref:hypothetical protein n=1 Tax=Nonomuraea wenchangensis TaxID=568860 RepID=UPI00343A7737
MSRGLRHLLGAVTGLAALAPVYYLTEAGARALRAGTVAAGPSPTGLGCLLAVAAIVAMLTAWPPAALACGLPLAAAGTLFALDATGAIAAAATLPYAGGLPWTRPGAAPWAEPAEPPGTIAGLTGLYALIGVVLVLSALLPRGRRSILGP